jgi:hypothetical protein
VSLRPFRCVRRSAEHDAWWVGMPVGRRASASWGVGFAVGGGGWESEWPGFRRDCAS